MGLLYLSWWGLSSLFLKKFLTWKIGDPCVMGKKKADSSEPANLLRYISLMVNRFCDCEALRVACVLDFLEVLVFPFGSVELDYFS
jgi:hypothetical protein